MPLPDYETLTVEKAGVYLRVLLNRPEQRNAINQRMSGELNDMLDRVGSMEDVRAVVLRGAGGNFCAGGDIKERSAAASVDPAGPESADPIAMRNMAAGGLFSKIDRLPKVVVAVVEGAALGGGLGFACVADITIVDRDAKFGMPEVSLGVAPAQIAPYVARRIGESEARRLALTAQRFDGAEAHRLGIAHYCCQGREQVDACLAEVLGSISRCGPLAIATTKEILLAARSLSGDEMAAFAAARFAALNRSEEGREGQRAFVEKRKPAWISSEGRERAP